MANINSSSFLNCWQIVHRATIPNPDCERWRVSEVDWHRQRHTFAGGGYSFAIEVHTLVAAPKDNPTWSLMVVVEHWSDREHEALRTTTWARRLTGNSNTIVGWVKSHEAVRRKIG